MTGGVPEFVNLKWPTVLIRFGPTLEILNLGRVLA
jgi:hypothetical protein